MGAFALTGNDTFIINDIPITDLSNGSTVTLNYPNEKIGTSTGKNENTVFAENKQGGNANIELRVLRGSATDKYLNGLSILQDSDFVAFPLMNGAFSKRIGDGQGNITFDTHNLMGGAFLQDPDSQENVEGDPEQGTVLYRIFFSRAKRALV